MPKPVEKRVHTPVIAFYKRIPSDCDPSRAKEKRRRGKLKAVSRDHDAQISRWHDHRRDDEGNRLAATLGARISCRRRAQEIETEAQLEQDRRQAGLPSCWQNRQQRGRPTIPASLAVGRMRSPKIGPPRADQKTLDAELAHLRKLNVEDLQARWHTVFRRRPLPHLSRHLLFRVLAYRLQADRLDDLDAESRRLLDCSGSPEEVGRRAIELAKLTADLRPRRIIRFCILRQPDGICDRDNVRI